MPIRHALFACAIVCAPPAAAQPDWRAAGPAGGPILALAADSAEARTLYAGTGSAGIFVSVDGGTTWRAEALPAPGAAVFAVVSVPGRAGVAIAATDKGLFRRRGPAGGWDDMSGNLGPRPFLAVAVDPGNPDTIFAGTLDAGVQKTMDGGRNWVAINQGLRYPAVRTLALDARPPGALYAGTFGGGVFRSADGGRSWKAVNKGMGSFVIQALAVDRANGAVFAATAGSRGGLFRSMDSGENWARLNVDAANAITVALDDARPGVVWVGDLLRGLHRSEDGGTNWKAIPGWPRGVGVRAIVPGTDGTRLAAGNGIWLAVDTARPAPAPGVGRFTDLAVDPRNARRVAAVGMDGAYLSDDGGKTWRRLPETSGAVRAVAIDAGDPRLIWLGGEGGLFRSLEGAAPESVALPAEAGMVLAVAALGDRLLVAASGGLFVGANGGRDWSPVPGSAGARTVAIGGETRQAVLVAARGALLLSDDGGKTWRSVPIPVLATVQAAARAGQRLIVGMSTDLLASDDDGRTWQALPLPASADISAIAVDPRDPARVAVGTSRSGAWISRDGGKSWTALAGIDHPAVTALAQAPDGSLWAATFGHGLFNGAW